MPVDKVLENIRNTILGNLPRESLVTRIEFEGPKIVIYSENPLLLLTKNEELIKAMVKSIKKRIVVRADPKVRVPIEVARRLIMELVPPEAEVKNIFFNELTGEVEIEALRPGYAIGRNGSVLHMILEKTLWRPKVIRYPPQDSRVIRQVRQIYRSRNDERYRFLNELGQRIHRSLFFKDSKVRVVALGGFGEVGRSAILVQTQESNVLLDAGIKPTDSGEEYPYLELMGISPEDLDAVVITHAHLDHCGLVPFLYKYGYRGPVYSTEPTIYLMKLLQEDYVNINIREGRIPLYNDKDIAEALVHAIPLKYGEVTDITPDIRLTLHEAGHILGSAMVHLHIGNGLCNIVYTGDFKFERTRLLEPANYKFPRLEVLIMESTYGGMNDVMPSRDETERTLISIVKNTIERGGKVLIPVLAVGRAQEIMLVLADAFEQGLLPEVPIFLEGMLTEATAIHTAFPEHLSQYLRERVYKDETPFSKVFSSDIFQTVKDPGKRVEIVEGGPCIIMATSGMLNGGPVMDYLRLLAEDKRNSLVFVSYQIEGTLGRRILQGLREVQLPSRGGKVEVVKINMEVYNVEGFSGHSDRRQLVKFVQRVTPKPEVVLLNHGERRKIKELANYLRNRMRMKVLELSNADAVRVK